MLHAFVPREVSAGETRVAAMPDTVKQMVKLGLAVSVEPGAGAGSSVSDAEYEQAGATMAADLKAAYGAADLVLKLNAPGQRDDLGAHEADLMKKGAVLVCFLYAHLVPEVARKLADAGVTVFAMERVPRISRAQSMDALSSQANLGGYKAVVIAAERMRKIFPLMMTAAGTIRPAKVVILGAGVAGLQAIATAKRLGALVEVSDIRPAVKEQVESLGGRFIDVPLPEGTEDAGGYAKDPGEEFLNRQREILTKHIGEADAVITTALIPGKPAPRLVSEEMVKGMRPGSVVVDMAASMGGNCELTEPGQVVTKHGVTIVGEENLPGTVPVHASGMYARNVLVVVKHLVADGDLHFDFEDDVTAGAVVMYEGGEPPQPGAAPPPVEPPAEEQPVEESPAGDDDDPAGEGEPAKEEA